MKKILFIAVILLISACAENGQPRHEDVDIPADGDSIAADLEDALLTDNVALDDLLDVESVDDSVDEVTDDDMLIPDEIDVDPASDLDDPQIDNVIEPDAVDNVDNNVETEAGPEIDAVDEDLVDEVTDETDNAVDIEVDNSMDIDEVPDADVPAAEQDEVADIEVDIDADTAPDDVPAGMVDIPAGDFYRGCDALHCDTAWYTDSDPYETVYISRFFMDVKEVTLAQFKVCWDAGDCVRPGTTWKWGSVTNAPVNNTEWYMANAYCEWVGKRLPTEAEWEKAARGTDGRKYPWGNDAPAGQADISPYGVENTWGGVREWVFDWYYVSYYHEPSSRTNPQGYIEGELGSPTLTIKALRGSYTGHLEVYARGGGIGKTGGVSDAGIRCAQTAP